MILHSEQQAYRESWGHSEERGHKRIHLLVNEGQQVKRLSRTNDQETIQTTWLRGEERHHKDLQNEFIETFTREEQVCIFGYGCWRFPQLLKLRHIELHFDKEVVFSDSVPKGPDWLKEKFF